jgi:HK97 family phage major capsid protein
MNGFGKLEKAAVGAGSTASGNWAEDLVSAEGGAFADFVEYLRPQTILGRFGNDGIPALRRVPFRVPLGSQTGGGAGYWVGEGAAKPLTSFDFARTTLEPLKAANIAVLTEEVIRDSSANSEALVRDALRDALAERIDTDFIDPANAGTANVKPASITNGIVSIAASGTGDADDIRLDVRSLLQVYINANNRAQSAVLIMQSGTALALGMMTNALGQSEFNGIGMNGGTLQSLPVITSEYVPDGFVIVVNASDIYFADEGGIAVDMSREASLEMDNAPSSNSVTPTESTLVSLWQTNSVGFRAERTLNWARRRTEAVQVLRSVAWGGAVTAPTS